ncbi:MAG: response regulator transcription factor [Anaerovoracaceae bacterium]|jgi:DNA-binding response OmpR family regulator
MDKKILIVEDDRLIAELERDYLEADGFEVVIAEDGDKGLSEYMRGCYDLVILDVMLPGKDGFEICRVIRGDSDIPVVMVTARKEDVDKIRGLGLGADDYMVKPFSPAELVARVKAHIRIHERLKSESEPEQRVEREIDINGLRINTAERRVFLGGEEVHLVNKEYELLLFMAQNPGVVFSKDQIFEHVWGLDSTADTATVTVHINRLRDKIEKQPSHPKYIETVWGAGYRLKVN